METVRQIIKKNRVVSVGIATVIIFALITVGRSLENNGSSYNFGMMNQSASMDSNTAGSAAPRMGADGHNEKYSLNDEMMMYPPEETGESDYDPADDRQLIKTASLSMSVTDIDSTSKKIEQFVQTQEGFIAQRNVNQSFNYNSRGERHPAGKSAHLTVKVPVDAFETTLSELRSFALVVTSEYSNAQDITEQFADIKIRLVNKQSEEQQYRTLLVRATKISDVLEITRYINDTRTEVERLQGRINMMSNQIDLALIDVYLESEDQLEVLGISWNPLDDIQQGVAILVQGVINLIGYIVYWVILLPLVALYAVLYGTGLYIVYRVGRYLYRKLISQD